MSAEPQRARRGRKKMGLTEVVVASGAPWVEKVAHSVTETP